MAQIERLPGDDSIMQRFLSKFYSFFMGFLAFSNIKKILLKLKWYWQRADVSGKMLIVLFFAPSMAVLFWMLTEIAYVIVFTLPGIVIRIIAQILLFCIFWSAAVFFYEKFYCVMSEKTVDAEYTKGTQNEENGETEKDRKSKWRGKNSA
jgi:hypothetical protein